MGYSGDVSALSIYASMLSVVGGRISVRCGGRKPINLFEIEHIAWTMPRWPLSALVIFCIVGCLWQLQIPLNFSGTQCIFLLL